MAATRKPPDPSQSDSLTAYERWELPVMEEAQRQRSSAVALANGPAPAAAARAAPARAVKPPTAAELESIREAAYREGIEQGHQEGFKQGRDEGLVAGLEEGRKKGLAEGQKKGQELALKTHSEKISRQLQQLDSVLQALTRPLEQQRDTVEQALLQLVVAVARAVTFRELSQPSAQVLEVIRAALEALPDTAAAIRISVHPEELSFIQARLGPAETHWKLVADPQISPGGCRVENPHSLIDFTREKRFQTVIDQLLARQRDAAGEDASQMSGAAAEGSATPTAGEDGADGHAV